jgi:hypothetical protein
MERFFYVLLETIFKIQKPQVRPKLQGAKKSPKITGETDFAGTTYQTKSHSNEWLLRKYFLRKLHLDLNINTAWQFKLHQCVNSFCAVAVDIHQALVSAKLKLLARLFVNVR